MTRRDLLLAILAASDGQPYQPVQIQKATFLVVRNMPRLVSEGPSYDFRPYDYGPYDAAVYADAEELGRYGLASVAPSYVGRWRTYAATPAGLVHGRDILNRLDEATRSYLLQVSRWVREQSFEGLVGAIYQAYPEMRANSIFQDPR